MWEEKRKREHLRKEQLTRGTTRRKEREKDESKKKPWRVTEWHGVRKQDRETWRGRSIQPGNDPSTVRLRCNNSSSTQPHQAAEPVCAQAYASFCPDFDSCECAEDEKNRKSRIPSESWVKMSGSKFCSMWIVCEKRNRQPVAPVTLKDNADSSKTSMAAPTEIVLGLNHNVKVALSLC